MVPTRYITLLILFFLLTLHLKADEKMPGQRLTIAVMNFQANNCPASISRAVSEILAGKIYEKNLFTLLERNQINLIKQEHKIQEEKCADADCAAKMGRVLDVKKVVLGSVSRLGDWRLEMRIINVEDSSIDMSLSGSADDESDFDDAIDTMVERINNYYLGIPYISGDYDISISASLMKPSGDFGYGANMGYGTNINLYLNRYGIKDFRLILSTGLYSFTSEFDSLESLFMMPMQVYLNYTFSFTRNVKIIPSAGCGYLISRVTYDKIDERTYQDPQYSTDYYLNPVISLKAEVNLKLSYRWYLSLTPSYSIFFESNRKGQIISTDLGVKLLF